MLHFHYFALINLLKNTVALRWAPQKIVFVRKLLNFTYDKHYAFPMSSYTFFARLKIYIFTGAQRKAKVKNFETHNSGRQ